MRPPDAGNAFKPAIMCRNLQRLERVDVQRVVETSCRFRPDSGDRLKQLFWFSFTTHTLQLDPATGVGHFVDRASKPITYVGEPHQTLKTFPRQDICGIFVQISYSICSQSICAYAETVSLPVLQEAQLPRLIVQRSVLARAQLTWFLYRCWSGYRYAKKSIRL